MTCGMALRAVPHHNYRRTTMIDPFENDELFLDWCDEHHDDGFFVGYAPGYPPKIPHTREQVPRMHRARCKLGANRDVPEKKWTTGSGGPYDKAGSTDRQELIARFEPAHLEYC